MAFREFEQKRLLREERHEKSRQQILEASLELFYDKGFWKTTTRDIVKKAGILNGSLYYRFRSKEEILIEIVSEALVSTLGECEEILEKENNPLIAAVFPGALEVTVSSRDPKAANLLYEVHRIWDAVEEYTEIYMAWFSEHLKKYGTDFADTEGAGLKVLTFLGAVGNLCGYYADGGKEDVDTILRYMISYMSPMLGIPVLEINRTVETLNGILRESGVRLFGEKLCRHE